MTRGCHYGHTLNALWDNSTSHKINNYEENNIIKNKREEKSAGADTTRDVDDTHDIDTL